MKLGRPSRVFFIFLSVFVICATLAWGVAVAATPVTVEGIRIGANAGKTRVVIDLSGKTDYRAFTLGSPWRVLVDLPAVRWKVANTKMLSNALLKQYRSGGLDGGLTRIVFDLKSPAIIDNVFLLPKDSMNRDRLVIDIKPSSQNIFNAEEKKVFGDKNIRDKVIAAGGKMEPQSELARVQGLSLDQMDDGSGIDAEHDAPANVIIPSRKPEARTRSAHNRDTINKPKAGNRRIDGKFVVVVDAGHGGEDPGAKGHGGVIEKHITLAVARELKRQLEETGRYKVVLTRSNDTYIKLHERVDISRRVRADAFVSIHADKIGRNTVQGASIYTLSSDASDAETARLADQENNSGVVAGVDLSSESHDVAGILLDLAMREKMNESNLLARYIKESLRREKVRLLPNSHRSAGFAVLKAPDVPSVLIETGFLSNPQEAKLLSSSYFQSKIASSILKGLDAYFRKMDVFDNN